MTEAKQQFGEALQQANQDSSLGRLMDEGYLGKLPGWVEEG